MSRHPGTFERRGKGYRFIVRVNGKRHVLGPKDYPELRGELTENDRIEFATRIYAELQRQAERAAVGLPGPMRVSQLFDTYEQDQLPRLAAGTRKTYKASLDRFRAFFVDQLGNPRADHIRAPHIRQYLAWRERADGVGARTLAKDRATLHAVFSYAARELEVVDSNPVANVKPPKWDRRTPVILTDEQFEALLSACADNPMLHLYVLLLNETGTRNESEALKLRWEDIDLDEGFVWIGSGPGERRTKTGTSRWVPMTPRLRKALAEHVLAFRGKVYDGKSSPWVFHHTTNRRRAKAGERIRSLRRSLMAAAKRAGIPADWRPYDLRHRRVTTWLAEGANPVHVKEAVGHSDIKTTMWYTHLAREHLRSLVEKKEREGAIARASK